MDFIRVEDGRRGNKEMIQSGANGPKLPKVIRAVTENNRKRTLVARRGADDAAGPRWTRITEGRTISPKLDGRKGKPVDKGSSISAGSSSLGGSAIGGGAKARDSSSRSKEKGRREVIVGEGGSSKEVGRVGDDTLNNKAEDPIRDIGNDEAVSEGNARSPNGMRDEELENDPLSASERKKSKASPILL
jgi:hypothetical protein